MDVDAETFNLMEFPYVVRRARLEVLRFDSRAFPDASKIDFGGGSFPRTKQTHISSLV